MKAEKLQKDLLFIDFFFSFNHVSKQSVMMNTQITYCPNGNLFWYTCIALTHRQYLVWWAEQFIKILLKWQ